MNDTSFNGNDDSSAPVRHRMQGPVITTRRLLRQKTHWSSIEKSTYFGAFLFFGLSSCVTPVVLDDNALRIGLFAVSNRALSPHCRESRTTGVGISLGSYLELGYVANTRWTLSIDSQPYTASFPFAYVSVGDPGQSHLMHAILEDATTQVEHDDD